ncbi:MAG: elongation factor Ts [Chloroflexota bacterium]
MECRSALMDSEGDLEKATQLLRERGFQKAEKKAERLTSQGLVEGYIHAGGRIGALVELNCETDFVARTDEFKQLAHNIAMQVAAMSPVCVTEEEMPAGDGVEPETACLLRQPYIKDPTLTIQDLIVETVAKTGENIKVRRFARFELGN